MKRGGDGIIHGKWYEDACGGAFGLELLGERWALLIVRELMFGARRFKDLRAGLPALSAKVLIERLHGLELSGIVRRVQIAAPASPRTPAPEPVQCYELTPWGEHADAVLLALCRWALASPGHDPGLFLSPAAMMMSLRALFDPLPGQGVELSGAIRMGSEEFAVRVVDGQLAVARAKADQPGFTIAAADADAVKRLIYGKAPAAMLASAGLTISGDIAAANRFVALCNLPAKWR